MVVQLRLTSLAIKLKNGTTVQTDKKQLARSTER